MPSRSTATTSPSRIAESKSRLLNSITTFSNFFSSERPLRESSRTLDCSMMAIALYPSHFTSKIQSGPSGGSVHGLANMGLNSRGRGFGFPSLPRSTEPVLFFLGRNLKSKGIQQYSAERAQSEQPWAEHKR